MTIAKRIIDGLAYLLTCCSDRSLGLDPSSHPPYGLLDTGKKNTDIQECITCKNRETHRISTYNQRQEDIETDLPPPYMENIPNLSMMSTTGVSYNTLQMNRRAEVKEEGKMPMQRQLVWT